jgi:hypothetical protein
LFEEQRITAAALEAADCEGIGGVGVPGFVRLATVSADSRPPGVETVELKYPSGRSAHEDLRRFPPEGDQVVTAAGQLGDPLSRALHGVTRHAWIVGAPRARRNTTFLE